jgi:pyruvate ferredoxin oxidoreductase alpha subunit
MVCMDGFVLTHAVEEVEVPSAAEVAPFLPSFRPRQVLDPDNPITIGAMVGPEAFTEVRFAAGARQIETLDVVEDVAARFAEQFGRASGGVLRPYRLDDAEIAVVALGSVVGAAQDVVDDLRSVGVAAGALEIGCYRPWPAASVRAALTDVDRVLVVERAFAPGAGPLVGADVRAALTETRNTVVAAVLGLGGRPVTRLGLRGVLDDVLADRLDPQVLHFPDLDGMLAAHALADIAADRAPGEAEPVLRYGPAAGRTAAGRW